MKSQGQLKYPPLFSIIVGKISMDQRDGNEDLFGRLVRRPPGTVIYVKAILVGTRQILGDF